MKHFVIKNSAEEYWNNSYGWGDWEEATQYSESQKNTVTLPPESSWIESDEDDESGKGL